ncbi:hypothetical protein [uncultured Gimesia sp.]|uniref:hypothetical protein n=1 Tax=uncultured Gimesia sp. TaxID=1678688 RepID=UPI0030DB7B9F|tara:strand:- start:14616 stop:16265 length:1650 start_codon:yes stop_codon:yes gene_type:complete
MTIDVACPACGGSIQIEDVAEVVACPLCQIHLQIDPETNEPVLVSEETEEADTVEPETSVTDADSESETEATEPEKAEEPETAEETGEQAEMEATPSDDAEAASPFSFLPGANENRSDEKQSEPSATNFSFLPGGSDETAEEETEAAEITENDSTTNAEENAGMESVHAFSHSNEESTDNLDLTQTEPAAESAAPFSFVPDSSNDSTEAKAETSATTAEETETPVEEDSAEVAESTLEEGSTAETETTPEGSMASETTEAEITPTEESSAEPESTPAPEDYRKPKVVSKRLFTLTLTYALAATIMVAMLLYAKYLGDPHQLESLPDLKPPIKNDEIALQLVPENAEMPPGHTLKLGGPGRRFGNILVTPLRITRGPLEFEHYTGDTSKTREPSQDVLKLYLKFENVSSDQTFEPLDQKLLLTRVSGKTQESSLRANNFVSRVDQKRTDGKRVLTYDMPPSWEWNLKGQNINQEAKPQNLEPGESFETYVATNEEGIDDLKGELVWRLQLRKGYNSQSYRGVTTLIEVVFNSDQIETEAPSKTEAPQATS